MPLNLILASTSTIYGGRYLSYLQSRLRLHFKDTEEILFIPYARPSGISHERYTAIAQEGLKPLDKKVRGLHEFSNPKEAVAQAQGIFTGGGNTFVLLNELYKNDLFKTLKKRLLEGTPYLGTSAGSNICGRSIHNTNDMPIVYPPSFEALNLIPFNINPHYIDPLAGSKHMGETRETRIKEFHSYHKTAVVGLREGSWLEVTDKTILQGTLAARVFRPEKTPYEIDPKSVVCFD